MSHHKVEGESEKIELLVFGYACKLFRDDERAMLIDSGTHLIPWMGDDSLKIDRYDGRGALNDLVQYEPKPGEWDQLSPEELEVEQKCDRERYRSLYINDEEDTISQEEIMKRAQVGSEFSQVSYSYDEKAANEIAEETQAGDKVPSNPFVPPVELNIPPDMVVPETMKHHAIIERTATFIAQQGSQMEILMRVKQNSNKKFDFLGYNDPLHNYYKHLLALIKSGSYVPLTQDKSWSDDENDDNSDDEHYLHPSLASAVNKTTAVVAPPPALPAQPNPPPIKMDLGNPPESVQKIVEKMVTYVVKNGPAFETIILKRKEARFSFLDPSDPNHKYYKGQLAKREECIARTKMNKKETILVKETPVMPSSDKSKPVEQPPNCKVTKKKPMPVCFSIKKPKESEGLEVPSALPVEDSTDEEESTSSSPKPAVNTSKPTSPSAELLEDSEVHLVGSVKHKKASSSTKNRSKQHLYHEKDSHLQKERKMKVALFLKDLKNKS